VSAVAARTDSAAAGTLPLEWAVLSRARAGNGISGDLGLVRPVAGGVVLAAIDGLGHGAAARSAASTAAEVVARAHDGDVMALMSACHDALAGTRGAAISLAFLPLPARTMTWLALGDVEGRLLRGGRPGAGDRSLLLPGGVAGHDVPTLIPETLAVTPGDVLVLATDGVDPAFADTLELSGAPGDIGERILSRHWDRSDDALVLVLRWLPDPGAR
jgi:negative regulator of sigma-B (phosphoserine phosphatase)